MSSIQLKTYAKINLSLDAIGVREDGYHEIEAVMQAVDLWGELELTVSPALQDRIAVEIDHPEVPGGESNIAYRAAEKMLSLFPNPAPGETDCADAAGAIVGATAVADAAGTTAGATAATDAAGTTARAAESTKTADGGDKSQNSGREVRIKIEKKIPVAAGLAGGSSNAAGVILGLNKTLNLGLRIDELCEIGKEIGADVPFCIMSAAAMQEEVLGLKGGTACALAEGIGEILTPLRSVLFWTVLAKPPVSVSTAEVYRALDGTEISRCPDTTNLISGIASGNMQKIKSAMCNVLESVTFKLCPQSESLKKRMEGRGEIAVMMSGSGPTVYALFGSRRRAEALASSLRDLKKQGFRIILTKTL